jgi:pre-mRNA-splicing factor ATP-dependent RNA helicase DHX38/PRP16
VKEVRTQLKDIAQELGFAMSSCGGSLDVVRKAVCSGYFTNAARFKGIGEYINLRTGMSCKLHPSSALFSVGFIPEYIVYHELVLTSK